MSVGSGDYMVGAVDMVVTPDETKAYVADNQNDCLYEVDIATGNRVEFSSAGVGTGAGFTRPYGVTVNPSATTAYVTDVSDDAVYAVDLSTGNRTVVSDDSTGTGDTFDYPAGIAVNAADTKIYVSDTGRDAIIEVDISTGNRTVVSGDMMVGGSVGTGPDLEYALRLSLSPDGSKAYAVDDNTEYVVEIDLSTGNRTNKVGVWPDNTSAIRNGLIKYFVPISATEGYATSYDLKALLKVDLTDGSNYIVSK